MSPHDALGRDVRWFAPELEDDERATKLADVVGYLYRQAEPTRALMVSAARMYGNLPLLGLSPRLYRQNVSPVGRKRISLNCVKSVVDTYTALVTKDQPKISFVTSGGDWSLQKKAKRLEKFCDGTFYESNLHLTAQDCARDSALFGVGIVKLYCDESNSKKPRIEIERVLPWELLCDDQEAQYGRPSSLYHLKFVDKRVLAAQYPKLRTEIEQSSSQAFDEDGQQAAQESSSYCDLAVVVEGWHLPEDSEHPGRHTTIVGTQLLEDEEWTYEQFPFELLYRQRPIQGVWGYSLADELGPIQVEIARLLYLIQRAQTAVVGHWLIEENAGINTSGIDNVQASMIRYTGVRPEYVASNTVAPDIYSHLDRLWTRAFEVVGISSMTASSLKPPGLSSGKAMLVYSDVQSQRFAPCYREYQHWHLRLARQCIHLASQIAEKYPGFSVKAPGRDLQKTVRWADAHLDEEDYSLELFPTNALADDPAARLQVVQDMINSQMIKPEDGRRLLNMPDLEQANAYENSIYDNVMRAADRIIEDGEYFAPEEMMGAAALQDAVQRMTWVYFKARLDDVPEDKLELLRRWVAQAQDMATPPPPPQLPPPNPGPTVADRTRELQDRHLASQTAQNLR